MVMRYTAEEFSEYLDRSSQQAGVDLATYLRCKVTDERNEREAEEAERRRLEEIRRLRVAAEPMLMEIYRTLGLANGARFDSKDICTRLGLEINQGNLMWISRKLESYRKLEHQPAAPMAAE